MKATYFSKNPAARRMGAMKRQHHTPCPVPCTNTKAVAAAVICCRVIAFAEYFNFEIG